MGLGILPPPPPVPMFFFLVQVYFAVEVDDDSRNLYFWYGPLPVTVTTRIITCLVEDSY